MNLGQGVEKRISPYEILVKSTSKEAGKLLRPLTIFLLPHLPLAALFQHRLDLALPDLAQWKHKNHQDTLLHVICREGSLAQWKQVEDLFHQNRFEMDRSILNSSGHSPLFLLLTRSDGDEQQIRDFFTHFIASPSFNPNLPLDRKEGLGTAGYLLKRLVKPFHGRKEINGYIFGLLKVLIENCKRVNWNTKYCGESILFLLFNKINAQSLGLFQNPIKVRDKTLKLFSLLPRSKINLFIENRSGFRLIDELLALSGCDLPLPGDFSSTLTGDEEKVLREIFAPKKLTREEFHALSRTRIDLYYKYSCLIRGLSNRARLDMIAHLPKPVKLPGARLLACLIDPSFRASLLNQLEFLSQGNIRLLAGCMQYLLSPQEMKRILANLAESNLPASAVFLSELNPETVKKMGLQSLNPWSDISSWRQWIEEIENKAKQHDESYVSSLGSLLDFLLEFFPLKACLSEGTKNRPQEEDLNQLKKELSQLFESKLDLLIKASVEIYQQKLSKLKNQAASFAEQSENSSEEECIRRLQKLKESSLSFYQALSQWAKFDKLFEEKNSSVISEQARLSAIKQLTAHRNLLKTLHQEAYSLHESCSSSYQVALSKKQEAEDQLPDEDAPQLISTLLIQLNLPSFQKVFGVSFQSLWNLGIYEGRDLQVLGWNNRLMKACSPFSPEQALSSIQKNSALWKSQIGFDHLTDEEKELWKEAKLHETSLKSGEFSSLSASSERVKTNNHLDENWAKQQAKASRLSLEPLISWNQRFNLALLKRFLKQEDAKKEVKKLLSGGVETLSQWKTQNPDASLSLYALSKGVQKRTEAVIEKKRKRDEAFPQ